MEQRENKKFCFKLGKKFAELTNYWKKFMVMILWVVLKFTRGLHDLKMAVTI